MKVGKVIELFKVLKNIKSDEENIESQLDIITDAIAIYKGVNKEEVLNYKTSDATKEIAKILDDIEQMIDRAESRKGITYIATINNKKVKFVTMLNELPFGAFIDMQMVIGEIRQNNLHPFEVLDKVVCTMMLTYENGKYVYKSFENVGIVREIEFEDVYRLMAFFLQFRKMLEPYINLYLTQEETAIAKLIKKVLKQMNLN